MNQQKLPLKASPTINIAMKNQEPIVAIESTIFAHGLPRPINLECALQIEEIIKNEGAVPAIIAIDKGHINIGCEIDLLEKITSNQNIEKVSTRDIAYTLISKKLGATTVAGTITCASEANIDVMVTGGIGGIHRNVNNTHDISADLTELQRNKVAVVCSGIKSILDVPKTLEALETLSIPVIGYKTESFPCFFSSDSGYPTSYNAESTEEIAHIINQHASLNGGILVANPPPKITALDLKKVNKWTEIAQKEADNLKISGKQLTPFLLKRLTELSKNKTLKTNIDLVCENAKIASKIAVSLCDLNNK